MRFEWEALRRMEAGEIRGAAGLVARAANRHLGKSDREAAGVLSSAQRHTHFLTAPAWPPCSADPISGSRI